MSLVPFTAHEKSRHSQQRKNRKRVAADSDVEKTTPSIFHAHRQSRRRVRNRRQEGKLDDQVLNKCLGDLWKTIPSEKKDSHDYIDCLWFEMYHEGDREKALGWIRRDRKFSKKYVFLPICLYNHWNLLIFCDVGKDLQSKATTPFVLLLDLLREANAKQDVEKVLREFLLDIYQGEGISASKKQIDKIPLLVPKLPGLYKFSVAVFWILWAPNSSGTRLVLQVTLGETTSGSGFEVLKSEK